MSELSLAGRKISPAHKTLIIAEIGVNHDGSIDRALELVDLAANAGAEAGFAVDRPQLTTRPGDAPCAY